MELDALTVLPGVKRWEPFHSAVSTDSSILYSKSRRVNLAGDTCCITLMDVQTDDSVSIGWRPRYRRVSTKLYGYTIGSDEPVLIHSW